MPFFHCTSLNAQTSPDAGSLLREAEQMERDEVELTEPEIVTPDVKTPEGPTLEVVQFVFSGNTLLDDDNLDAIATSYTGRRVSFGEISAMLEEVSKLYRNKGYLARVYLPEQDIRNGIVRVEIMEARFGQVRFDGDPESAPMDSKRIEKLMAAGQNPEALLRLDSLERAALIANDYPAMSSKVVLSAGERVGFTDIVVVSESTNPFSSTLLADNHGSRSTGEFRAIALAQAGNLLGRGELFQFNALLSEGNRYGALNFQIPVGVHGLTAGVSTSLLDYNLVGDFKPLDADGDAFSGDLNLSYPLIWNSRARVDLRGRIGRREYSNTQLGANVSDKEVDAFKLELRGRHSDSHWGGGQTYYGLDLTSGNLDLSDNLVNQALDEAGPRTAGSYQTYGWNVGRLQRLSETTFLNFSLEGQWASKNLDSSETFVLGGPAGVRAYPVLEGTGDEGWLAKIELSRRIRNDLTLSAFYDHGDVTRFRTQIDSAFSGSLKGVGAGLNWNGPSATFANLSVSHRIGNNPWRNPVTGDDSDGSSRDLRVWLRIGKSF